MPPVLRGQAAEQLLGKNLPYPFKTIDSWYPSEGRAVSIKSVDVGSPTYADLASKVRGLVNEVSQFARYRDVPLNPAENTVIRTTEVAVRELQLAIQPGKFTPEVQRALSSAAKFAAENGVKLRVFAVDTGTLEELTPLLLMW